MNPGMSPGMRVGAIICSFLTRPVRFDGLTDSRAETYVGLRINMDPNIHFQVAEAQRQRLPLVVLSAVVWCACKKVNIFPFPFFFFFFFFPFFSFFFFLIFLFSVWLGKLIVLLPSTDA